MVDVVVFGATGMFMWVGKGLMHIHVNTVVAIVCRGDGLFTQVFLNPIFMF